MIRACLLLLLFAMPAQAQQLDPNNSDGDRGGFTLEPELDLDGAGQDGSFDLIEEVEQEKVVTAPGGVLRALDRVSGLLTDLELSNGQTVEFGRISVTLSECRYPEGNPSSEAYAHVIVQAQSEPQPRFQGWMVGSSPALNALDHPRYDVWVLRCKTS